MLDTVNVRKSYGRKAAVDNFSIRIEEGHVYGLLGPNGSGKSTWMKMVTGLIVPDAGTITLDGTPIGVETKKQIAYMSTEPFYYNFMKIKDVGRYYKDFFEDYDETAFERLIGRMDLQMDMKVRTLSSGMAAKLKIAATMSRRAKIILLDEPLNGIDLVARDEIIRTILEYADGRTALVISSHLVEELERVIDTVIFMENGQLADMGDVEDIRQQRGESIADYYREIYR